VEIILYKLRNVIEKAGRGEDIYPRWKTNDVTNVYNIEGYTRLTTISQDGDRVIYHANPHIQGRMWYDWAYVHFEEVVANMETQWKNCIQPKF